MIARKSILLGAFAAGAIVFVVWALVGAGASHARSPCRPFQPVPLTGTLIEVRQGDTVIPNEEAILEGVPRWTCLAPSDTIQQTATVHVADCDFPEFFVNATLTP